jgi:TPR repeat protein
MSAKLGVLIANFYLGLFHINDNIEKSIEHFKLSASTGHAESNHNLGLIYDANYDYPYNYELAFNYYEKAAEKGLSIS